VDYKQAHVFTDNLYYNTQCTVVELLDRSALALGIICSNPARAMCAFYLTNTVCVGFLAVIPFPPTLFTPPQSPHHYPYRLS